MFKNSAGEVLVPKVETANVILPNEHAVLPVSVVPNGQYGLSGLALSIPSVVGQNGLEDILEIPLSSSEKQELDRSVRQMEEAITSLNL